MENNFELKQCSENDALEFKSGTYRIKKILETISQIFTGKLSEQLCESLRGRKVDIYPGNSVSRTGRSCTTLYSNYFTKGVDCEILRVGGQSWEKGKFKINISLEFIPDDTESPLDEVRKETKSLTNS